MKVQEIDEVEGEGADWHVFGASEGHRTSG